MSFRLLEYRVAREENGSPPGPLPGSFKPTCMTWASPLLQHLQQRSCSLWFRYRPVFLFCKNRSGHIKFAVSVSFCVSGWRGGFGMVRVLQRFNLETNGYQVLGPAQVGPVSIAFQLPSILVGGEMHVAFPSMFSLPDPEGQHRCGKHNALTWERRESERFSQ